MVNLENAFVVEDGLSLSDEVFIFSGSEAPEVALENAPKGSLYLQATPSAVLLAQKGATEVTVFGSGSGGGEVTNIDGGHPDSVYGGIGMSPINGGAPDSF